MPEMLSARRQRSEISLQAVYELVVGETVGVFTYLSHCEAENMMLKRVTPLRNEYAAHPATRLYLGEPWGALVDCDGPLLAPLPEFAAAEGTYITDVVPKVIDMWQRAGLTFTDGPGPYDLQIEVSDPQRDAAA
jgi:hypothetical protein